MTKRPIDVPRLAHSYKRLVLWFGAQLVLNCISLIMGAAKAPEAVRLMIAAIVLFGAIATIVALAIYSYRTASALGFSMPVLWAIAMFLPCANVITLLALSAYATSACKANGIPVGFLGPKGPVGQTVVHEPSDLPPRIDP